MNIWNIRFRTFFEYFKGITDAIMNPIKYCGNLLKLIQLLDGLQGVPLFHTSRAYYSENMHFQHHVDKAKMHLKGVYLF